MGVYRLACLFCKPRRSHDHLESQCGWQDAQAHHLLFPGFFCTPFANFAFCVKTTGLGENKVRTSEVGGEALGDTDVPSLGGGSVQDSWLQFQTPSGSRAEDAGEDAGEGRNPWAQPITQGHPLWPAASGLLRSQVSLWRKLSGLAWLLDCVA